MKLKEITPEAYLCSNCQPCCPAVLEADNGKYIIIGKKLSDASMLKIQSRVADDEYAIEVERGMIDEL